MNKTLITLAACSLISNVSASGAQLLLNVSFETPVLAAGSTSTISPGGSIGGWQVTGGTGTNVLLIQTTFADGNGVFTAQDGLNSLDLNGFGAFLTGVSQTVATVIGSSYQLSFYLGDKETSFTTGPASLEVFLNGVSAGTFSHQTNSAVTSWAQRSFSFNATSGLTTVELRATAATGNNYVGLDNVALDGPVAVPEPSTGVLVLVLCGLSAVRRIRQ